MPSKMKVDELEAATDGAPITLIGAGLSIPGLGRVIEDTADFVTITPDSHTTYSADQIINNWRVVTQGGSGLTVQSDRVIVNKAGVYTIVQSFLCNTGYAGSDGNTRIMVNGIEYVAGYSFSSDSGGWEKSVAAFTIECASNDYIQCKCASTQHIWGASSGVTHSPFTITRVGAV